MISNRKPQLKHRELTARCLRLRERCFAPVEFLRGTPLLGCPSQLACRRCIPIVLFQCGQEGGANQSDRQATECENGNKDGRWHCLLSTRDEQPRQRGRRKVVPRQLGKAQTAGCRHGLKWRSSQTQPQSSQRAHFIAHGGPRMPARNGAPRPDRRSASTARGRSPRSHPATNRPPY
jgi:hypothetical protein